MQESDARLRRWEDRAEWPLAVVAIVFLVAYSIDVLVQPAGSWAFAVSAVTWVAWVVFAVDYLARLALAHNRWRWFVRHLLDLAVLALPFLRSLRLLRFVVLVGALQKAAGDAIRGRVVAYTVMGALLLVWVASLAVLEAERGAPGSDITTLGQALWWSVATITTVGYGDLTPVTATGRVVAVLLMIGGISLVGFITATIASWIVQRVAEEDTKAATVAHVESLRAEVRALREEIRALGETSRAQP